MRNLGTSYYYGLHTCTLQYSLIWCIVLQYILLSDMYVLLYRGMSRNEAALKFLLRVKWLDGYGLRLYTAKV